MSCVFVCSSENEAAGGTIDMKIRLTSPNAGLKLKGVNYDTVKTQLLVNFSRGRAPSLRLIHLWFHQSNEAASTGSIHAASL